jgi:hypothetical protein
VAAVSAKSQGGVDTWDAAQNLHIYGYKRVAGGVDYSTAEAFIDNVVAVSPAEGAADNSLAVYRPGTSNPYYYEGNYTYDFYGFYVDDLAVTPSKTADGVYVPVEITGGEDLMLAKADPEADYAKSLDLGIFSGDQANWNVKYAYSAYAARRGVHPSLTFKHQLVRFRFYITSGSDFETTGTPENLVVKGLTVTSKYKADLGVVGNNTGLYNISEDTAPLSLLSLDPATKKLVDLVPYEVPDKDLAVENDANLLGESLMVIPGETSYDINLTLNQFGEDNNLALTLNISDVKNEGGAATQSVFTAGYSYKVYINVVGIEKVELSAELEDWKDGGRVDIDSDDAPEVIE